jgi:hypothetical protein
MFYSFAIHPNSNRFSIRKHKTWAAALTTARQAAEVYCQRTGATFTEQAPKDGFQRFGIKNPDGTFYGFDAIRQGVGWCR